MGLSIQLCSQLRFTIANGYESKSAEGKGTWVKSWRKPGTNCQESFLSGVIQDALNSQQLLVIIHVVLSTRKAHYRLSTRSFYTGLAMEVLSA